MSRCRTADPPRRHLHSCFCPEVALSGDIGVSGPTFLLFPVLPLVWCPEPRHRPCPSRRCPKEGQPDCAVPPGHLTGVSEGTRPPFLKAALLCFHAGQSWCAVLPQELSQMTSWKLSACPPSNSHLPSLTIAPPKIKEMRLILPTN